MGRGQGGGGGGSKLAGGGSASATAAERTESGTQYVDAGIAQDSLTDGLVGQKLTDAEEDAILVYTESGYAKVNATLGGYEISGRIPTRDEWSEGSKRMHENLPTALSKLPAYEGTTTRNITVNRSKMQSFINQYEVGQGVEIGNYFSTSKTGAFGSKEILKTGGNPSDVVYTIRGKRGRDITSRSAYKEENEVLFTHGSKFKVTNVTQLSGGGYHIELEQ